MDKKAKLFTKRFAERLARGKPQNIKKKSLLLKSIHNVSKESLKRELNKNFDLYLKYLNKCLKRLTVETPTGSEDFKLIQTWEDFHDVVGLTKHASRQLCTRVTLKDLESERADFVNILQKYEEKCEIESKEMVPAWMAATKHLLASTWNAKVITKLMLYYLSKLQCVAEDSMQSGENVESITGELKQFLLMSYLRSRKVQVEEPEASSKRPDVLASLLSIYIDLLVYMNRDNEKKKVSREITSLTSYLLRDLPVRLDVLIQITSPVHSTHVLPFARSCLEKIPETLDHATYLRVMLCLRKYHNKIPDIIENSWKVRAPLGFIDWLQDKSPEAMTQIPDDIRFKGRQITHFLLTNLSEDVQSVLEDVLTDRQVVSDLMLGGGRQVDLKDEDGGGDECGPEEEQPLFVMDRGKTTDDRKSKQKEEGKRENKMKLSADHDQEEMDVESEVEAEGEDVETSRTVDNTDEVEVIDLSNVLSAIYDNKPVQYMGTEYVSTSSLDSPKKKSKSSFTLPATKSRKSSKLEKLDQVDEIVLDTSVEEPKDTMVPNLAAHLKHGEQVVPDIFIVDDSEAVKSDSFTQMKTKGKKSITVSVTSPETVDSDSEDFTLVQMLSPNKKSTHPVSDKDDVSIQNVEQISGKGKKRLSSISSLEDNVFYPKRTPCAKVNGKSPGILKVNSLPQSPNSTAVFEIEDTDSAIDTDKEKNLLGSPKHNLSRLTASSQKETIDSDKEQRRKMRDSDTDSRKPTSSDVQQDGSVSGMGLRSSRRSANSASESELVGGPTEQQMSSHKHNKPRSPIRGSVSSPNMSSKKVSDSKILSPFIKPNSTVRDTITRSRNNSEKEDASQSRRPRGSKKSSDEDVSSPVRGPSRLKKKSVEDTTSPVRSPQGSKKSSDEDISSPVRSRSILMKKSVGESTSPLRSPRGSKKSSDEDISSPERSRSRLKQKSDEEAAIPVRSPRGSKKSSDEDVSSPVRSPSRSKKKSDEEAAIPVRSPRGSKKSSDEDVSSPVRSPSRSKKKSDEEFASPVRNPQWSKKSSDEDVSSPVRSPSRSKKKLDEEAAIPVRSPRGSKKSSDEDVSSPVRSPSRLKKNLDEEAASPVRSPRVSKKNSDEDVSSPVRSPSRLEKKSDEEAASPVRSPQGSKKSSDEVSSPVRSPSRSKRNSDEEAASSLRCPRGSKKNLTTRDAIPFSTLSVNKDLNEKSAESVRSPRQRSSTSLSPDETEQLTETPRSQRKKHEFESSASPQKSEGSISPAKPQLISPVRQSSPVKKQAPDNGSVTLKTPSRTPRRKSAMSAKEMSSVAKEAKVLTADTMSEDDVRKSSRKRRSTRIETDDEDAGPSVKTPRRGKTGSKLDESCGPESSDVFSSPDKDRRKASTSLSRSSDNSSKTKITKLSSSSDQDIEGTSLNSGKKMKKTLSASNRSETDITELSDSQRVKTNSNTPGKNTVQQTPTKGDVKTPRRSSRSTIIDSPMVTRSGRKIKTLKKLKTSPFATPSSKSMQTIREDSEDREVVFNMTPAKQRKGGSVTTPLRSARRKTHD